MPDHVHMIACDPTEICGFSGGRIHQGQERDPFGAGIWREKAQFRGPAFLGAGILRFDRGPGRRTDPGIYPQPGTGRCALGAVEPVAMTPARL